MILLVALCVAMSMSAQGAARTKPATATQRTTATPPRTNAAAMRANAELFQKGMQYHQSKNYTQAFSCFEKVANQGIPQGSWCVAKLPESLLLDREGLQPTICPCPVSAWHDVL